MQTKLIFLDLDGTLKNDEKVIPTMTKKALLSAERRGVRLVLASARPAPGLLREARELQLAKYGGILMSYNGGMLVDAATGAVLSKTAIPRETAKGLLTLVKSYPVTVILDDGKQFFVEDKKGYKVEYECRNNCMRCKAVKELGAFLSFDPVKLLLAVEPELLEAVKLQLREQLPEGLTVVQTADFYLEILPETIHKGMGLLQVCELTGIAPEDTMAFGDAENDIPMLRAAGKGVAMGNSAPAVQAAANFVTKTNNEDGIPYALRMLEGGGCFTYMLRCADGTYYIGWTNDLPHRLEAHNSGRGAKYTKGRGPVELVYREEFFSKEEATAREWQLKQLSREQKEKLEA